VAMHSSSHPGEFIRERYIEPFDISIRSLAENLGVAASTLARIVSERSAVSPEMALRLSKAIGRSPESWLPCRTTTIFGRPESLQIFRRFGKFRLKRLHKRGLAAYVHNGN
jgi:addiction module HigA family antidote